MKGWLFLSTFPFRVSKKQQPPFKQKQTQLGAPPLQQPLEELSLYQPTWPEGELLEWV